MKDYRRIASDYRGGFADLAELTPATAAAFGRLVLEATADGALTSKVKELIALAIAISARSEGCIAHHVEAVRCAGASRREVAETIGVAILMGGGAAAACGVEALRAFGPGGGGAQRPSQGH